MLPSFYRGGTDRDFSSWGSCYCYYPLHRNEHAEAQRFKWFTQGYTAGKWVMYPGGLTLEPVCITTTPYNRSQGKAILHPGQNRFTILLKIHSQL